MVPVCAQARSYDEITKEVKVRNFNGIRAGNRFEVDVEKASKHTLELTFPAELEEYVTAEVQSGVLVLTLDLEKAPRDIRREFNSGDWKLLTLSRSISAPAEPHPSRKRLSIQWVISELWLQVPPTLKWICQAALTIPISNAAVPRMSTS